jgi:hypothetical protein
MNNRIFKSFFLVSIINIDRHWNVITKDLYLQKVIIVVDGDMARKGREAAKKAKDKIRRRGKTTRVTIPGILFTSRTKDPMKRELYLAAISYTNRYFLEVRDPEYQEMLLLFNFQIDSFGGIENTLDEIDVRESNWCGS